MPGRTSATLWLTESAQLPTPRRASKTSGPTSLPDMLAEKSDTRPDNRGPAAAAELWVCGSTLDFTPVHPRRGAAAPRRHPSLLHFRRTRRRRDHRRFLWDRFFLARTSCGGNDRWFG